MSVWEDALRDMLADPNQAADIVYVPVGGAPVAVRAIVDRLDEEAMLGGDVVNQRVLSFTFATADVSVTARGDVISYQGSDWYVGDQARSEEEGAGVTVRAERADD